MAVPLVNRTAHLSGLSSGSKATLVGSEVLFPPRGLLGCLPGPVSYGNLLRTEVRGAVHPSSPHLKVGGFCTYLRILLRKLLEHVGIDPAVPLVVLLSLFLAHGDLQSCGLILGVYFQHFLKVALG